MKDNLKKEFNTEQEFILLKMEIFIKEISKMVCYMVKVRLLFRVMKKNMMLVMI